MTDTISLTQSRHIAAEELRAGRVLVLVPSLDLLAQVEAACNVTTPFCGIPVGFEKEGVPRLRTGRADMTEAVGFIGV